MYVFSVFRVDVTAAFSGDVHTAAKGTLSVSHYVLNAPSGSAAAEQATRKVLAEEFSSLGVELVTVESIRKVEAVPVEAFVSIFESRSQMPLLAADVQGVYIQ